jgi:hypothetical protein
LEPVVGLPVVWLSEPVVGLPVVWLFVPVDPALPPLVDVLVEPLVPPLEFPPLDVPLLPPFPLSGDESEALQPARATHAGKTALKSSRWTFIGFSL